MFDEDKAKAERNRKRRLLKEEYAKAEQDAAATGKGQYVWTTGGFGNPEDYKTHHSPEPPQVSIGFGNSVEYIPAPNEGAPAAKEVWALYDAVWDNKEQQDREWKARMEAPPEPRKPGERIDFDAIHGKEHAFYAQAKALDVRARKAHGDEVVAVGRIYSAQVGDGYAQYLIDKVGKTSVHVLHLPLFDAYRDRAVSPKGSLPMRLAKQCIEGQARRSKVFGKEED